MRTSISARHSVRAALPALLLLAGSLLAASVSMATPAGYESFQLAPPYHTKNPFTKTELTRIESGFTTFTTETFAGNGRTCSTCHIPEKNYNVTAADVAVMTAGQRALVFGGTNTVLENVEIIETLGLFNINQSFGAGTEGNIDNPHGPFRASMSIGGIGLSTLNNYVCRPGLLSPGGFGCTPGIGGLPFNNLIVDDGIRDIMLGWAGEGSLVTMFPHAGASGPDTAGCEAPIADFFADQTHLEKALGTFALAAVKTHFPRTQDRVPGVDFRCPTAAELENMAKFQKWLGRRFELDITKVTMKAAAAQEGRNLFSTRDTACVACHVNAGASDTQGRVKNLPVPFLTREGLPDPELVLGDEAFVIIGSNKTSRSGTQFFEPELDDLVFPAISTGPLPADFLGFEPFDQGDHQFRGRREPGFNVQSIIEATRKQQFFHNNAIRGGTIEDAIAHYFTDKFDASQGGTAVRNAFRGRRPGPEVLASLGGTDALDKMGVFLRALSSTYAIADCERFLNEAIDRVKQGMKTDLPVRHCRFALDDARKMLVSVPLSPNPYAFMPKRIRAVEDKLIKAQAIKGAAAKQKQLTAVRNLLPPLRRLLLTTPELP